MTTGPVSAIYPGTFDPVTNGHLDIIVRAVGFVDRLIIGVADNKSKQPMFSLDDRSQMLRETLAGIDLKGTEILVQPFSNLLVDFATDNGASLVIRGLRAVSDFEYEIQMGHMNARLNPTVETVFLMASEHVQAISSRFVKEIFRLGGDVSGFVPPPVLPHLLAYNEAGRG